MTRDSVEICGNNLYVAIPIATADAEEIAPINCPVASEMLFGGICWEGLE